MNINEIDKSPISRSCAEIDPSSKIVESSTVSIAIKALEAGRKQTSFIRLDDARLLNPGNPECPVDLILCVIDGALTYAIKYHDLRRTPASDRLKKLSMVAFNALTLASYYVAGVDGIVAKTMTSAAAGITVSALSQMPIDYRSILLTLPTGAAVAYQIASDTSFSYYLVVLGSACFILELRRNAKQWLKNGKFWGNREVGLATGLEKVKNWVKENSSIKSLQSTAQRVGSCVKNCFLQLGDLFGCRRHQSEEVEELIEIEEIEALDREELLGDTSITDEENFLSSIQLNPYVSNLDDLPVSLEVFEKDDNIVMKIKIGDSLIPVKVIEDGDDDDDDDDDLEKDVEKSSRLAVFLKTGLILTSIGGTIASSYAFGEGNTTAIMAGFSAGLLKTLMRKLPMFEKYALIAALMGAAYGLDAVNMMPMKIGFFGGKLLASTAVKDMKDVHTGKEPKNFRTISRQLDQLVIKPFFRKINQMCMTGNEIIYDDNDAFFGEIIAKENNRKVTFNVLANRFSSKVSNEQSIPFTVRIADGKIFCKADIPKNLKKTIKITTKKESPAAYKSVIFYAFTLIGSVATSYFTQKEKTWGVVYVDPFHVESQKQGEGTLNNIVSTPMNAGYKQTARNIHWSISICGVAGLAFLTTAAEATLMREGLLPFRFSYIFQGLTLAPLQKWGKGAIDDKSYFTKQSKITCHEKMKMEENIILEVV